MIIFTCLHIGKIGSSADILRRYVRNREECNLHCDKESKSRATNETCKKMKNKFSSEDYIAKLFTK